MSTTDGRSISARRRELERLTRGELAALVRTLDPAALPPGQRSKQLLVGLVLRHEFPRDPEVADGVFPREY